MKRIFVIALAFASMTMVSCKKGKTLEQTFEDYMTKLDSLELAGDSVNLMKVSKDYSDWYDALSQEDKMAVDELKSALIEKKADSLKARFADYMTKLDSLELADDYDNWDKAMDEYHDWYDALSQEDKMVVDEVIDEKADSLKALFEDYWTKIDSLELADDDKNWEKAMDEYDDWYYTLSNEEQVAVDKLLDARLEEKINADLEKLDAEIEELKRAEKKMQRHLAE